MRVTSGFLVVGFLLPIGLPSAQESVADTSLGNVSLGNDVSDDELIGRLFDQWAGQSKTIATAHIRHRTYSGGFPHSTLTLKDVNDLLSRHDLAGNPDSFRDLLAELLRGGDISVADLADPPWFVREYHQLGDKYRDRHADGTLQIISGDHEFLFEPGKSRNQATLFSRGGSWLLPPGMHLFLRELPQSLPRERCRVRSRGEVIELEIMPEDPGSNEPDARLQIDPATGMVTREVIFYQQAPYREHRQLGLTEYEGGIVLPVVSLTLQYRDGHLRQLFFCAIDSAVLNGPVDEDLFQMPVAANTVVVDQRGAEKSVVRSAAGSDDVVSFLAAVAGPPPGPPEPRNSLWRWVLTLNGLGLIVLSVVFWRRSQSADQLAAGMIGASGHQGTRNAPLGGARD